MVRQIKKLFMKKRYNAPRKNFGEWFAMPKPAVQRGGIRAVAIATPGITLLFSMRVLPIIPANPPKTAISTSQIVGSVRAKSSEDAVSIGENVKYRAEVKTERVT